MLNFFRGGLIVKQLNDVYNERGTIEKEISTYLAKCIKKGTGKGPHFIKVNLEKDYVLAVLYNILMDAEMRLALTEQGCYDVRLNRYKIADCYRENGEEAISKFVGRKVLDSFGDVNPKTNTAIMVWILEN